MKKSLILLSLFMVGCNPMNSVDALPEAKVLANSFFDNFEPDRWNNIYGLYGDEFWEQMPRATWEKVIPNVYEELGPIKKCELAGWRQSTQASTSGSGNFVSLSYSCSHSKYESTFSFTIRKPLVGGETKIVGQNISSLGLLLE